MNTLFIGVRKNEEEIISGPQKVANYLYNELIKKYKGFYYYGMYEDEVPEEPSKIYVINEREAKGPISKLAYYIKENKIDLVYFARYHSIWAVYIVLLKYIKKFKLTYTVHGIVKKESQINKSFKFYHVLCEKLLLKNCDRIITISHDLKGELLKYYPSLKENKIKIINNGVSIIPIKNHIDIRKLYQIDDSKKIIFTVGIRKIKNIEQLIEGYINNENLYNSAVLLVAGENDTDYSKNIIEKYKGYKNIKFIGLVEPNHLNNIYNQCDLFIQISEFETFGMSIVEAMLHKKNVLISSSLPISMYFKNGEANLYDKSKDDLGIKILECLSSDDVNEIGYNRVNELFNWRNVSEGYYSVFEEAFSGR